MREFAHEFVDEFFANFVQREFVRIRMNFLLEKLVMLRMACTVGIKRHQSLIFVCQSEVTGWSVNGKICSSQPIFMTLEKSIF